MSPGTRETIVIIDCGFQQTQLIARRVREKGVFSEVVPCDAGYEAIMARDPAGLIIIGGPGTVLEEDSLKVPVELLDGKVPVLGVCYGMPLIASLLGSEVERGEPVGFGRARILLEGAGGTLLEGFPAETEVWVSRWDRVLSPPPGFTITARSES
ncbi:MAG: GMP synthase (glutamine-hydrolyzing), partial [Thermovirgaceae bacterium]